MSDIVHIHPPVNHINEKMPDHINVHIKDLQAHNVRGVSFKMSPADGGFPESTEAVFFTTESLERLLLQFPTATTTVVP